MEEKWEWIVYRGHDLTGVYMVSDKGQVKSVDRYTKIQHQFHKGQILRQRSRNKKHGNSKTHYSMVTLWDNGKKLDVEVHRLVANAFIENPNGEKYVNHKDGNGLNNSVDNLEWCSASYNAKHSVYVLGNNPKRWKAKAILQKTLDGEIVKEWESAWEIQRQLGFCQVSISRCCRRVKKSGIMYGYLWDFKE
jgi:hypothetical protein